MRKVSLGPSLLGFVVGCLLLSTGAPAVERAEAKIVNGLGTHLHPSVGMLVIQGGSLCSGVLIGCRTFLTAAHCVCTVPGVAAYDGAQCNARPELLDPSRFLVFFQHAGSFQAAQVMANPGYLPNTASDLAILRLAVPVSGTAPTPIETTAKPPFGTTGTIVGFGSTRADLPDGGVKRAGAVTVSSCAGPSNAFEVCWSFSSPLGAPGSNSNICRGDSGSPLFVADPLGPPVVAGIASFGTNETCLAPDTGLDSDVFRDREWIAAQAGADLASTTCGDLPAVGGSGTAVLGNDVTATAAAPQARFDFAVPAGTRRLRIGLNGASGNQAYLYAKAGSPAGPASFDCKSEASQAFGVFPAQFCDIPSPAAGTWNVLAQLGSGPGGQIQATATLFLGPAGSPCVPDATTLCIDDQPGDRRFKVQVAYRTAQGGERSGMGTAISLASLGVEHGGLFWFFSPDNPEMLVKVVNACSLNGTFWVFSSAGTNVGLTTTVTDTLTGHVKTYSNPDLTAAAPVQDTGALPCN